MSIKRFHEPDTFCVVRGQSNGEYVLYTDHIAALEAVKATVKPLDRQKAANAAVKANDAYGQWMPERWLHLFLDAYEGKL